MLMSNDVQHYLDVSENNGIPKSSTLIGFSIIHHPFWGTPNFLETSILRLLSHLPILGVVVDWRHLKNGAPNGNLPQTRGWKLSHLFETTLETPKRHSGWEPPNKKSGRIPCCTNQLFVLLWVSALRSPNFPRSRFHCACGRRSTSGCDLEDSGARNRSNFIQLGHIIYTAPKDYCLPLRSQYCTNLDTTFWFWSFRASKSKKKRASNW